MIGQILQMNEKLMSSKDVLEQCNLNFAINLLKSDLYSLIGDGCQDIHKSVQVAEYIRDRNSYELNLFFTVFFQQLKYNF